MSEPIESLIPHRTPMRFIDALTDCTDMTATATARFSSDHFAVEEGQVIEGALIECVAQTVAAAQGLRAKNSGQAGAAPAGMLVAVNDFQIRSRPSAEEVLQIEVRELKRLGSMIKISGRIVCRGEQIARGELMLYV